jgi:hypothetical protein
MEWFDLSILNIENTRNLVQNHLGDPQNPGQEDIDQRAPTSCQ